jgi:hypothetical protein
MNDSRLVSEKCFGLGVSYCLAVAIAICSKGLVQYGLVSDSMS